MEKKEEKGIFEKTYNWFAGLTVKGLLGAILIAFVVLILVTSVSYIPSIMSHISSSLSAALYSVFIPADSATMTVDKTIVNSGEDFTVSFKKADTMNGLFSISYACDSGAILQSVEAAGLKNINCDKSNYLLDGTSIRIRPFTKDSVIRLALQGSFENNDTDRTDKVGVVRVIIKNNSAGVIVSTSTVSSSKTNVNNSNISSFQQNYSAKPDLAIRQLQIGLLNNSNNLITNQTQFSASNMVGIKFEIRNDGDADTGPWVFTASLPSNSTPVYNSATQISLKPGESIIFTLGFTNLTNQYNDIITVKADPLNGVSESNEYNNTLTSTITNTSYNSGYYMNNANNGCYINGVFTYNCNYYNNGGWNNNYNNSNLSVSCSASNNNPQIGQAMNWYPSVTGGNGSYSYYWSGTDNLSSYSQYPNITYYTAGYKTAKLTVTSGGYSSTVTCATNVGNNYYNNGNNSNGYYDSYGNYIYYNNNSNGTLGVTCYASPSNPRTGTRVYWYASAFGGNGNYTYSWDGTDGLNSSSQNPGMVYNSSGNKDAVVTVQSGGYYVSHTCSAYVSY